MSQIASFPQGGGEHRKYLKPPPSKHFKSNFFREFEVLNLNHTLSELPFKPFKALEARSLTCQRVNYWNIAWEVLEHSLGSEEQSLTIAIFLFSIWVSTQKYWYPYFWMVKIMKNPIKMDDLGGKNPIFGNIHMGT